VASRSTSSCHKWTGSVSPSTTISSVIEISISTGAVVAVVGGNGFAILPGVRPPGADLSWSLGTGCVAWNYGLWTVSM